jgi:predicted SAM-dependent methyltransferase|tara:strand:- start:10921 stop:11385 length:465 start_codon:yes stop_codon:yes gene_type:complete
MKVRITVGEETKLNGYLNIDPITKFDDVAVDIRNIDEVVENASCKELISDHILGFLEKEEAIRVLKGYMKKIRHNGTIIVSEIDSYEVARSFYRKEIDSDFFNKAVHGNFSHPWDVKMSSYTLEELADILASGGFKIIKKRLNGIRLTIEAQRP